MCYRLQSILVQGLLLIMISLGQVACKNTGAVCPDTRKSKPIELSPSNDASTSKSSRKKKPGNGLVQKKQPKRLNKK